MLEYTVEHKNLYILHHKTGQDVEEGCSIPVNKMEHKPVDKVQDIAVVFEIYLNEGKNKN